MTFSLGQCLLKLPANRRDRTTLFFEKSQSVPKTDDFSLFCCVHDGHSASKANVNEKRTKLKPLGFGPSAKGSH
jgi:hypothetical protein